MNAGVGIKASAVERSPQQVVQRAWQRAQQMGVYQFASEIVQTTYPAPTVANFGRNSHQETLHMVAVMDEASHFTARMAYRSFQRSQSAFQTQGVRQVPTDDLATVQISDQSQVQKALFCIDVGDVGHKSLVWRCNRSRSQYILTAQTSWKGSASSFSLLLNELVMPSQQVE
jgi:hypothetical protein